MDYKRILNYIIQSTLQYRFGVFLSINFLQKFHTSRPKSKRCVQLIFWVCSHWKPILIFLFLLLTRGEQLRVNLRRNHFEGSYLLIVMNFLKKVNTCTTVRELTSISTSYSTWWQYLKRQQAVVWNNMWKNAYFFSCLHNWENSFPSAKQLLSNWWRTAFLLSPMN